MSQQGPSSPSIPLYWWTPPTEKLADKKGDPSISHSNFGDTISKVVVEHISGKKVQYTDKSPKLLAVGSVLFMAREGDTIWGSGAINEDKWNIPPSKNISIRAIRGPLTRNLLTKAGFDCPEIYGDPALLMPHIYPAKPNPKKEWGYIPHIDSVMKHPEWRHNMIDVRWKWQRIIEEILSCRFIIASSLHGVIIAEAYGVPAIWLATDIPRFKFDDYYLSTGREIEPALTIDEALDRPINDPIPHFDIDPLLGAFPLSIAR